MERSALRADKVFINGARFPPVRLNWAGVGVRKGRGRGRFPLHYSMGALRDTAALPAVSPFLPSVTVSNPILPTFAQILIDFNRIHANV